ncbi:MAG: alpha/beta hydrolase [Clostridium sp.]|nr:alpha/beta hydrolase [Acetatifactor muris]MCM1526934.1 alpha/beta hydrolase [Bacteroides sp.]MCM1563272.1 alpha/beta hydrolase [Clostridium sp.]
MNLASVDMKKEFAYYNKVAPFRTERILGGEFRYRYYRNPSPKMNATILMLAGGSGLGDAFAAFARCFMDRYSLINFNYPPDYDNNERLADAIAELIRTLKAENVYLWGQSYGGVLAQIIAKRHPDVVKGLILTSTASLTPGLRFEGMQCLVRMLGEEKERKNIKKFKKIPLSLLPALMNLAFKKHLKDNPGGRDAIREILNMVKPDLTNEYLCHMGHLLGDLRNHVGTYSREDFAYLKGRVLIIEPDDDPTFTADIKETLIGSMPEPAVVREIPGGHLAMMLDTDGFVKIIDRFMDGQGL